MVVAVLLAIGWVTTTPVLRAISLRRAPPQRRPIASTFRSALLAAAGSAPSFHGRRRVLAANDGLVSSEASDVVGRPVIEVLGREGDPIAEQILGDLMSRVLAGESGTAELSDDDDDGAMRILEVEGRSVTSETGSAVGFLRLVDATERRGLAMRTAQSERMEALGALALQWQQYVHINYQ